ncbi:hypothetical protein HWV62_8152 [Athelia sp. TMB]|nr:hypothetical protein HWV62_8152 [Athelia sp. TMB]
MANKRKKEDEDMASETGGKSNGKKKSGPAKKPPKDKPKATASKAASQASKSSAKGVDAEANTTTLQCSARQTKGEGGTVAQLERAGEAVKHVPKMKKATVKDVPETSSTNPMAPDKAAPETLKPLADPHLDPVVPQFIVPPGTEPSLAVPALGGFYAYGHQYGFPPPSNQTANPPSSPQEHQIVESEPDDDLDTAMAIDPSLLTTNSRPSHLKAQAAKMERSSSGLSDESEEIHESSSDDEVESGEENGDEDEIEDEASGGNGSTKKDGTIWGGVGGGADDGHSEDGLGYESGDQVDVGIEWEGNEDPDEMFGPKWKVSTQPFKYEDSHVTTMLNEGAMVDGADSKSNLLRTVKKDWMADNPTDPTFATYESTKERTPAGAAPGYDVLQRHRSKNRVPGLSKRQRQQGKSKRKAENSKAKARRPKAKVPCSPDDATDEDDNEDDNDDAEDAEDDSPDDDSSNRARARRHSKKPYTRRSNNPTQLGFYPRTWQDVLGTAKMNWRVRVASEWGFPKIREQGAELLECLTRAITEYENDNGSLEEGYYPKYKSRMIILVWEDTSSFRGELKKLARLIVPARYSIFPPQGEDNPRLNDAESAQYVKDAVQDLTHSGDFMHNGKDSKASAHEIPPLAVALVIAALNVLFRKLKCSLNEWAEGTYDPVDFQADMYRSQYEEIVTAVDSVVASNKHSPKFLQARREWAAKGILETLAVSVKLCRALHLPIRTVTLWASMGRLRAERGPNFSGGLASKNKPDLQDITEALGIAKDGNKANLLTRINAHFDSHVDLKFEARYVGLFHRARAQCRMQAADTDENTDPTPPLPTLEDVDSRAAPHPTAYQHLPPLQNAPLLRPDHISLPPIAGPSSLLHSPEPAESNLHTANSVHILHSTSASTETETAELPKRIRKI